MLNSENKKSKMRGPLPCVWATPINCPRCGSDIGFRVRRSLVMPDQVRRYVTCLACGRNYVILAPPGARIVI